jgi:hypothetical protein
MARSQFSEEAIDVPGHCIEVGTVLAIAAAEDSIARR